jgi:hypothetical protein
VPEEPGGVHAQEAAGQHHERGESHQVLVREQYTQWALLSDKIASIRESTGNYIMLLYKYPIPNFKSILLRQYAEV